MKYNLGPGPVEKRFGLTPGKRLSVGRTRENDLALDHTTVSKMHASLLLNNAGKLVVADTGSTNGTYLNGERIAYGKAIEIFEDDKVKFGAIEVELKFSPEAPARDYPTVAFSGDFAKKTEVVKPAVKSGEDEV